jgi:hypothetical protein
MVRKAPELLITHLDVSQVGSSACLFVTNRSGWFAFCVCFEIRDIVCGDPHARTLFLLYPFLFWPAGSMVNFLGLPPEVRNQIYGYALAITNRYARLNYGRRKFPVPDRKEPLYAFKLRSLDLKGRDINNPGLVTKQLRR